MGKKLLVLSRVETRCKTFSEIGPSLHMVAVIILPENISNDVSFVSREFIK